MVQTGLARLFLDRDLAILLFKYRARFDTSRRLCSATAGRWMLHNVHIARCDILRVRNFFLYYLTLLYTHASVRLDYVVT